MNKNKMKGVRAILRDLVKTRRIATIIINAQGGKLVFPALGTIWRNEDMWGAYQRSEEIFKNVLEMHIDPSVPPEYRGKRYKKLLTSDAMKEDGTIDMRAIAAKALARNEALVMKPLKTLSGKRDE